MRIRSIYLSSISAIFGWLAISKVAAPEPFIAYVRGLGVGSEVAHGALIAILSFEFSIATGSAYCAISGRAFRWPTRASLAFGIVTLVIALASKTNSCGCFGAMAEATQLRRIVVSLGIMYLSLGVSVESNRALEKARSSS